MVNKPLMKSDLWWTKFLFQFNVFQLKSGCASKEFPTCIFSGNINWHITNSTTVSAARQQHFSPRNFEKKKIYKIEPHTPVRFVFSPIWRPFWRIPTRISPLSPRRTSKASTTTHHRTPPPPPPRMSRDVFRLQFRGSNQQKKRLSPSSSLSFHFDSRPRQSVSNR